MKHIRILFIIIPLLLLVSCGSVTPTSMDVTRVGGSLPTFNKTVTNTSTVQSLYNAALALPNVSGTLNCSLDTGLKYLINFKQGSNTVQNMSLDATGCQLLHIGQSDARRTNPAFLAQFEKAVGLTSLTQNT